MKLKQGRYIQTKVSTLSQAFRGRYILAEVFTLSQAGDVIIKH